MTPADPYPRIPWWWLIALIAISAALALVIQLQRVAFMYGTVDFFGCQVPEVPPACADDYDCMRGVCARAGGELETGPTGLRCRCKQ